jgi:hypothetical protein
LGAEYILTPTLATPSLFDYVFEQGIRTIPIKEQFNWHQRYMSALAFKGKMVFGDG